MQPEARYLVMVDDETIRCTEPDGQVCEISLHDLESVAIRTTDTGPFLADVWWVLTGGGHTCFVPQGATGEKQLMDRLFALPEFRFDAVIEAMGCADNADFLCWEK